MNLNWIWLLLKLLQGGTPSPTPTPTPVPTGSILAEINNARAANHKPPFQLNSCLATQSQAWAETMRRSGYLSHDGFSSRLSACKMGNGGEVVAEGQRTPKEAVAAWMTSSGHREILLSDHTFCGAGNSGLFWSALVGNAAVFWTPQSIDPLKSSTTFDVTE